jgi:4-amino-4-deoxy-L-arabinose transferase-like glycosyltransferase
VTLSRISETDRAANSRLTTAAVPLILLVLAIAALAIRVPALGGPLLEKHPFRQTWTAYTAVIFHETGIDLLRPQLPVYGPPFTHPQEFPLFQALAAILMDLGVADDLALRLTALGCFALTAFLLFGLVRRVAGPVVALVTFALFVFSPFSLLWSRASLIEYLVTAAMVGYVWAGLLYRERRSWLFFGLALVAGSVAMLVKPSAGAFAMLPLGLAGLAGDQPGARGWLRARLDPRFVALFAWPLALAVGWTLAADGYFLGKETAAFLAPSNLREYYFGSLADRADLGKWRAIFSTIVSSMIGPVGLALLVFGPVAARRARERGFWIGLALAGLLPIVVVFGGFGLHDYYTAEVSWSFVTFTSLGAVWVSERVRGRFGRGMLAVGAAAAMLLMWALTPDYWGLAYGAHDLEHVLPRAHELGALTRPDDLVVMVGQPEDFDPDVLYYARRRGLLLVPATTSHLAGNMTPEVYRSLPSSPYRIFFSFDPTHDPIGLQRLWRWSGVLGLGTYIVGPSPADLRGAPIVATDDQGAFDTAARGARSLLAKPLTVPCDGIGATLARGSSGTWLRLSSSDPDAVRIRLDTSLGPMPTRPVVVLGPEVAPIATTFAITCNGAQSITIDAAVDAPPPGR